MFGKHCFRTSVGKGSKKKHVDELIDMANFKIVSTLTVAKLEKEVESEFLG